MPADCCEYPKDTVIQLLPILWQIKGCSSSFLFSCLRPCSRGKTVHSSSVVWLISDKLCSLQLQECVVRKKGGVFGTPEEAADYYRMLTESVQALALTPFSLQKHCSGVCQATLNGCSFSNSALNENHYSTFQKVEISYLSISKLFLQHLQCPARDWLHMAQSPLGCSGHTHKTKIVICYIIVTHTLVNSL